MSFFTHEWRKEKKANQTKILYTKTNCCVHTNTQEKERKKEKWTEGKVFHCMAYFIEWLIDDAESNKCYCINPKIEQKIIKLATKLSESSFVVFNFLCASITNCNNNNNNNNKVMRVKQMYYFCWIQYTEKVKRITFFFVCLTKKREETINAKIKANPIESLVPTTTKKSV